MASSRIVFAMGLALSLQLTATNQAYAQVLTATECSAKLPSKQYHLTGLYDGDDTIYLFGGYDNSVGSIDQTLRYSIPDDQIEAAGRLPLRTHSGTAFINKQGNIIYIPGSLGQGCNKVVPILQYFPDSQTFTSVSSIPENYVHACVMPDEDRAFLFGGRCHRSSMVILDMNNLTSEVIGNVLSYPQYQVAGIWADKQEAAYLFHTGFPTVQKFTRSSNRTDALPLGLALEQVSQVVWDGRYAYVIGGINGGTEKGNNSIIQFDPDTETASYIRVEGYPDGDTFWATAAVYVKKLNRIYMFGGSTGASGSVQDKIWYISLDPLNPPAQHPMHPSQPLVRASSTVWEGQMATTHFLGIAPNSSSA